MVILTSMWWVEETLLQIDLDVNFFHYTFVEIIKCKTIQVCIQFEFECLFLCVNGIKEQAGPIKPSMYLSISFL